MVIARRYADITAKLRLIGKVQTITVMVGLSVNEYIDRLGHCSVPRVLLI